MSSLLLFVSGNTLPFYMLLILHCIYLLDATNDLCGERISNSFSHSQPFTTHLYNFSINNGYAVHFDTCNSPSDIWIKIISNHNTNKEKIISETYCAYGDDCGSCSNSRTNYTENFTIPYMQPDEYIIKVGEYDLGNYEINIQCSNSSINNTDNTTDANHFNSTSVTHDINTDYCNYEANSTYTISSSQIIFDSIYIENNAFQIQFEIQLNDHCNKTSCNIFYFHSDDEIGDLSLSINGIKDFFEISVINKFNFPDVYRVANAAALLPVDNSSHIVYLSYKYVFNNNINYNENVFKIDNSKHYYYSHVSSSIPSNKRYQLYMSSMRESSVNGSISGICVKSSVLKSDFSCGNIVKGELEVDNANFHFFNLTNDSATVFDPCGSSFDTLLYLYNIAGELVKDNLMNLDDNRNCQPSLSIPQLPAGQYVLRIQAFVNPYFWFGVSGPYVIRVTCNPIELQIENVTENKRYQDRFIFPYLVTGDWYDSQGFCEEEYDASLAIINTIEDMDNAIHVLNEGFTHNGWPAANITVWLGMYTDIIHQKWQWITKSCVGETGCMDKIHWHHNQPDGEPSSISPLKRYAATMLVNTENNSVSFGLYDMPLSLFAQTGYKDWTFLCNGPDSYKLPNCTNGLKCWNIETELNDIILVSDITVKSSWYSNWIQPIFAAWNSKIYIIGRDQIHYVNLKLFQHGYNYNWSHMFYNKYNFIPHTNGLGKRYAQYESSLYLHTGSEDIAQSYLVEIDLENSTTQYHLIPNQLLGSYAYWSHGSCVAASEHHVYIISFQSVITFNVDTKRWNKSTNFAQVEPKSCSITNDGEFIYVHGISFSYYIGNVDQLGLVMIKYDTSADTYTQLDSEIPNLCVFKSHSIATITTPSGNMIFQGCGIEPLQTLIFDPNIDAYNGTVDISGVWGRLNKISKHHAI
eukprot:347729_1